MEDAMTALAKANELAATVEFPLTAIPCTGPNDWAFIEACVDLVRKHGDSLLASAREEARLRAERDAAREALKPFAELADIAEQAVREDQAIMVELKDCWAREDRDAFELSVENRVRFNWFVQARAALAPEAPT